MEQLLVDICIAFQSCSCVPDDHPRLCHEDVCCSFEGRLLPLHRCDHGCLQTTDFLFVRHLSFTNVRFGDDDSGIKQLRLKLEKYACMHLKGGCAMDVCVCGPVGFPPLAVIRLVIDNHYGFGDNRCRHRVHSCYTPFVLFEKAEELNSFTIKCTSSCYCLMVINLSPTGSCSASPPKQDICQI